MMENDYIFKPKISSNYEHKYQLTFTIEANNNMVETLLKAETALRHVFYDYNLSIVEK